MQIQLISPNFHLISIIGIILSVNLDTKIDAPKGTSILDYDLLLKAMFSEPKVPASLSAREAM